MRNFLSLFTILAVGACLTPAFAGPLQTERLIIAIDKKNAMTCQRALDGQIDGLKAFLDFQDVTTGTDLVRATMIEYMNYHINNPSSAIFGLAVVQLEFTSQAKRNSYFDRLIAAGNYTVLTTPFIAY